MLPTIEPLPEVALDEQIFNLPAWCYPGFSVSAFQYTPTVIVIPPGVNTPVLSNNPRRWAIGFQLGVGVATPLTVSNDNNPGIFGTLVTANIADCWFEQFKYGPMIQWEWWAFSAGGANLKTVEIELQ